MSLLQKKKLRVESVKNDKKPSWFDADYLNT